MSERQPLPEVFIPQRVDVVAPVTNHAIWSAGRELLRNAPIGGAAGYFPGIKNERGPVLEDNKALAKNWPDIEQAGLKLNFNFTRCAKKPQQNQSPYHLDADAETGVNENTLGADLVPENLVWRLLLNLHGDYDRHLTYANVAVGSLRWQSLHGYVSLAKDEEITPQESEEIVIPNRQGKNISGVLFCASRVAHSGRDRPGSGHFIACYGVEVPG